MSRGTRLLLAVASGLAYAAAFPPFGFAWVAFVALIPITWVALEPGTRAGRLFLLGWLSGTIATTLLVSSSVAASGLRYFGLSFPLAWIAGEIVPQIYGAPYFGLFAVLAGLAARGRRPLVAAPLIAAAWVTCDLLRSRVLDGCPWVLLAHSQHAHPLLLQVADLGGVAAPSFVIALVNAALALALRPLVPGLGFRDGVHAPRAVTVAGRARPPVAPLALAAVVLAATLLYGRAQLARWSAPPADTLRVAVVQGNLPDAWRYSLRAQPEALARLEELTSRVLSPPPDLVVWPENAVSVSPDATASDFAAAIRALPPESRLLVGAPRAATVGPGRAALYNSAFLIAPDGARRPVYDKLRLTPWAEGPPWPLASLGLWKPRPGAYSPGEQLDLPELRGHPFGVSICSEAIDARPIREQVARGATFLVNVANDGWFDGRPAVRQHAAAAALRAVENRRELVRVTATGVSQIVGPDGVVRAEIASGVAGAIADHVGLHDAITLYTRVGDALAWLCVAAVIAAALLRPRSP
ncbi:MAG: apolipoprotein N-acyltransferase [Candidatus Binatia bacterium]